MKLVLALLAATFAASVSAQTTYVPGYVKTDGTYVQGHYKTTPNDTKLDNYSTKGNVNPYTAKAGTVDPYKPVAPVVPAYVPPKQPTSTCLRDFVTGKCL